MKIASHGVQIYTSKPELRLKGPILVKIKKTFTNNNLCLHLCLHPPFFLDMQKSLYFTFQKVSVCWKSALDDVIKGTETSLPAE